MNNKISIIVPVYNAEDYLKRCLDSLINQTYKNIEIIIIDDSSTDNSKEIIKKYASKDNRIRTFFSEINQGVSKSRNIGLKSFSGDYVLFMDSDDYLKEDALELMFNKSIKYNADVVDSYHLIIYTKNNKEYYFTEGKVPKEDIVMGDLSNIDVLTKSTYITGKLIKKELLTNLTFDESLRRYEDLVFEHNLKMRLKNMVFLKDVVYYYYQVPNSLVNSLGEKHVVYIDAVKEVMKLHENSSKEIREILESLFVTNALLTGITKVIKNDKSVEENKVILKKYFNEINNIFPNYNSNKKINFFVRKYLNKLLNSDKQVYKIVKRAQKINFIDIYFMFLSVIHKYRQ